MTRPPDGTPLPESGPTGPVPEASQPGHHPAIEQDKPSGPPRRRRRSAPPGGRGRIVEPNASAGSSGVVSRFEFEFQWKMVPWSAAFGVTPLTTHVEVSDDGLSVRFGLWQLQTPLANVVSAEQTGPFDLWKVAGPARLSLADRGVTFATTTRHGVCISFHEPVPAALPMGLLRHSAATVTVQRADELIDLLS